MLAPDTEDLNRPSSALALRYNHGPSYSDLRQKLHRCQPKLSHWDSGTASVIRDEGSGIPVHQPWRVPLKAGYSLLGYPTRERRPVDPSPEILGARNLCCLSQLHSTRGCFSQYLRANVPISAGKTTRGKDDGTLANALLPALAHFHDDPNWEPTAHATIFLYHEITLSGSRLL